MESKIKILSTQIAKAISERSIFEINNIAVLIEVSIKEEMEELVSEYASIEERRYLKLLTEQSKNKPGSREYVKLGYELSLAKAKKAAANRAVNNIKRTESHERLRNWVIQKYGIEDYREYLNDINQTNQP
ncbi:hypothetical protein [Polluticaenibacter yanchengensis]|uniref:Uncharacterized protein n=1 Tax=Polluticaenibacter yanchengensis TaxID=3014562 RepID=A0ABT4UIS5_9BACT|nr:hypothetical protein [Chitinophagaceae bacterium LY-5]